MQCIYGKWPKGSDNYCIHRLWTKLLSVANPKIKIYISYFYTHFEVLLNFPRNSQATTIGHQAVVNNVGFQNVLQQHRADTIIKEHLFMMKVVKLMFGDEGRCGRSLRGCATSAVAPRAYQLAYYPLYPVSPPSR